MGRRGEGETRRGGDAEMGRWGDGETRRRGDGETRRGGDAEMGRGVQNGSAPPAHPNFGCRRSSTPPNSMADLQVTVAGDTLSVAIDGKEAGSFSSPGMAHPTKMMLRFSAPRNAVVDDVKIYRKG